MRRMLCCAWMGVYVASISLCCAQDVSVITASATHSGYLFDHERVTSPNGAYALLMQKDGNLVLYDAKRGFGRDCAVWSSGPHKEDGRYFMMLQSDGNLVVYKGTPPTKLVEKAVWHSDTAGPKGNYFLNVQDDANLVIYRGTPTKNRGAIWSSRDGRIRNRPDRKPGRRPGHGDRGN